MLLNIIVESWVCENVSVILNGVSFLGSKGIGQVSWVLLEIELDAWVLKDGIVVFDSGVLEDTLLELDTWSLTP